MKRFFPILTASFCIIGLGAQVSSGMILPFEAFPDATADYKSTATPPVDTLFLTPDEAMGLPLANLKEKKIHSPSGKLMLILSPNEHAWFRDGKLARYLYVASKGRKQRAGISSPEDMPLIIPNVNAGIIYDVDLFASKIFTTDSSTKSTVGPAPSNMKTATTSFRWSGRITFSRNVRRKKDDNAIRHRERIIMLKYIISKL